MIPGMTGVVGNNVQPGTTILTSTAGGNYTVPEYNSMRVQVYGPGGGGESTDGEDGTSGGTTFFGTLIAGGGEGGGTAASIGGTATGGTINLPGETVLSNAYQGGSSGGYPTYGGGQGGNSNGENGSIPGGGGAGHFSGNQEGGAGGGYVEKTYLPGELAIGSLIAWDVGAGGQGGTTGTDGGDGARGEIRITIS